MDSVHFPNPFHPLPNPHQALSGQAGGEAGEGDGKPPPTAATWSTAPLLERPRPCRRVNGWRGAAGASPATLGVGLPLQAPSCIFLRSVRHLHRLIVVVYAMLSRMPASDDDDDVGKEAKLSYAVYVVRVQPQPLEAAAASKQSTRWPVAVVAGLGLGPVVARAAAEHQLHRLGVGALPLPRALRELEPPRGVLKEACGARGFREAKRRTGRGHEGGGAAALQRHPAGAGDMAVEKTSDELMAGIWGESN
ncbi:hypothetical protein OsI_21787 [Oryza sativa Indica Group]|uniref:Uncharacterized protein n=1 Tax=Oryza sativa subsp. indica TaxID=39946 RepID=B8B373_ORYSI|nr:hypothetical protein OsI_21787 [Oryza sativa Indica Group]